MFLVLLGFLGMILHCFFMRDDGRLGCCTGCCFDCGPGPFPMEPCIDRDSCYILAIVCVIIFGILGIAYGLFAAIFVLQRIWQRHYHIRAIRQLTKVFFLYV